MKVVGHSGFLSSCVGVLVALLAAFDAQAQEPAQAQRRGGFVAGFIGGGAVGWTDGHPKSFDRRDDPAFEVDTGLAGGYRLTPFIGGALTDWFLFGLGWSGGTMWSGDHRSTVSTFVFHLEAYPLYGRGGLWRDLGLAADMGAGEAWMRRSDSGEEVASSGAASTVGLGVFWESTRLGPLALGPTLNYQHNWSRWYSRHDWMLGLRASFYGEP